jgi:hypothetical protein
MSEILTFGCSFAVMQLSDRLVSIKRGTHPASALVPYDLIANKSLVYRARNALVAVGYVGLAFPAVRLTTRYV